MKLCLKTFFIVAGTVTNEVPTFALNTQFDVPVVILSNYDNAKLLQQSSTMHN